MKIGILTHHYIKNYGAFLQVYALQETLKKAFPNDEIYVINYIKCKHLYINIACWFRFNPKKDSIKTYFQKITIPFIFSKFEKKYLNTTKKVYNVKQVNKMNFDTIIIGSDEVWNYEDKKSYDSIKFGKELTCPNIITYAPSTGKSNINNIPSEVIEGTKNIKAFSARDDATNDLIVKILKKECTRVLDPTFLYEFPNYKSKAVEKLKKEKYILMYYCDKLPNELKEKIIDYAKTNNLKIYGAGEYQNWFDNFKININPFEWVEMFKNAEIIFTGTFHGTVFSIKSKKQFYNYLANPSRIKKVKSLLEQFVINNRIIDDNNYKQIFNNINNNMKYENIYKNIEKYKITSKEYLKRNIK